MLHVPFFLFGNTETASSPKPCFTRAGHRNSFVHADLIAQCVSDAFSSFPLVQKMHLCSVARADLTPIEVSTPKLFLRDGVTDNSCGRHPFCFLVQLAVHLLSLLLRDVLTGSKHMIAFVLRCFEPLSTVSSLCLQQIAKRASDRMAHMSPADVDSLHHQSTPSRPPKLPMHHARLLQVLSHYPAFASDISFVHAAHTSSFHFPFQHDSRRQMLQPIAHAQLQDHASREIYPTTHASFNPLPAQSVCGPTIFEMAPRCLHWYQVFS